MYHIEATFGLLLYFYAILLLDISLVNKHVNIYWRILFQSEVRLTSAPIATVYIQSYDKNTTSGGKLRDSESYIFLDLICVHCEFQILDYFGRLLNFWDLFTFVIFLGFYAIYVYHSYLD